jgi:hypothetical protein
MAVSKKQKQGKTVQQQLSAAFDAAPKIQPTSISEQYVPFMRKNHEELTDCDGPYLERMMANCLRRLEQEGLVFIERLTYDERQNFAKLLKEFDRLAVGDDEED